VGPAATTGLVFEFALIGSGLVLLFFWWRNARRNRPGENPLGGGETGTPGALPPWPGQSSDLLLLLLLALGGATALPGLLGLALRHAALPTETRLVLGAAAFQGGLLAGVGLFHVLWGREPGRPPVSLGRAWRDGAAAFLVALPLVYGVSLLWQALLGLTGLPVEKQDVVELFMGIRSLPLRVAFILIATVVAPVTEELLFRAGLFRFFRGRTPRWIALGVPALLFGGSHLLQAPLDSLAVLAPLVMLGVVFSLAYERTGRITTTMIAHSLFNLNTIMLVLLGLNT
jgi:membrane protease YdiL (CAAX protease family)